jgi:hypothetical protein
MVAKGGHMQNPRITQQQNEFTKLHNAVLQAEADALSQAAEVAECLKTGRHIPASTRRPFLAAIQRYQERRDAFLAHADCMRNAKRNQEILR